MKRCSACCEDFNINPLHLVLPNLMGPDGREFVEAHGIDIETLGDLRVGAVLMDNGEVKIKHRCEQLTDEGLCSIYENRPKICRDFDCRLKTECTQVATTTIPIESLKTTSDDHGITDAVIKAADAFTASYGPEDDE